MVDALLTECSSGEGGPAVGGVAVGCDHSPVCSCTDQNQVLFILGHHHVLLVHPFADVDGEVAILFDTSVVRGESDGFPNGAEVSGAVLGHPHRLRLLYRHRHVESTVD